MIENLIYDSPLGKSDHCTLRFIYKCCTETINHIQRARKMYNKANYNDIIEHLNTIDWERTLNSDDIDQNWDIFLNTIKTIEDKFIPTTTKTISKKHKYPLDKNTRNTIKLKHNLSRKVSKTNDPDLRKQYNRVRNKVKKTHIKC